MSKRDHSSMAQQLTVLRDTPLVKALHTKIRDKSATRHQFVTASNRLVRLLIEEALALLPNESVVVETPCGPYEGTRFDEEKICAVSIMRAADCMLGEVRAMMPEIAAGKILIQRDEKTALPALMYSKLPPKIATMQVLLLDPMLATGGSAVAACKVLVDQGVSPTAIVFVNLVCVKEGLKALADAYPDVRIVTGAIDPILNEQKYIVPGLGDFGDRYWGTD